MVPRNTASTSPLTDLNAAFGLSASRRAASKAEAPFMNRANARAACAVSHGPPSTRPIRMTIRPGKAGAPIEFAEVRCRPTMNRTMPASSGTIRHAVGGDGVTRLLTPSGEIRTRRSDSSEEMAEAAGTPTSTARYPAAVGVTSSAKYRALVMAVSASTGCSRVNIPMPRIAPSSAPTTTEEMRFICLDVAPTSLSEA